MWATFWGQFYLMFNCASNVMSQFQVLYVTWPQLTVVIITYLHHQIIKKLNNGLDLFMLHTSIVCDKKQMCKMKHKENRGTEHIWWGIITSEFAEQNNDREQWPVISSPSSLQPTTDDVPQQDIDVLVPVRATLLVVEAQCVEQLVLDRSIINAAPAAQRHCLGISLATHEGVASAGMLGQHTLRIVHPSAGSLSNSLTSLWLLSLMHHGSKRLCYVPVQGLDV